MTVSQLHPSAGVIEAVPSMTERLRKAPLEKLVFKKVAYWNTPVKYKSLKIDCMYTTGAKYLQYIPAMLVSTKCYQ